MSRPTAFDTIVAEVMSDAGSDWMLEESMTFDPDKVDRIPLRYRVIALGFIEHFSLTELNDKLRSVGCDGLYARSLWEASLIYAFLNGMSYEGWKELQKLCAEFREEQDLTSPFFTSAAVTMPQLRAYVLDNSGEQEGLATKNLTRIVEARIENTEKGGEKFLQFLRDNVYAFSEVRETTRYYFCKYLYYLLQTRIDAYAAALETGVAEEDALDAVSGLFKGVTPLRRKKFSPEEAREFLSQAAVSCGGIFDAFNEHYFEYVSIDWLHALIESYGDIRKLSPAAGHALAEHLRHYDPAAYKDLSDRDALARWQEEEEKEEALQDEAYRLDGDHGYQRNRVGENTIRKYIKGTLDIDRTTLICFLLFFGSSAALREEDRITRERLSDILLRCRFPGLREEDDFDYFVLQYLEAEDPVDYLMQEVTYHAKAEENFYLYRVYKGSHSYTKDFEKMNT